MPHKTASEIARELGCRPRDISDLFYARKLDDSRCPIIAGRRVIPLEYVPEVRRVLVEAGKLAAQEAVAS
jgi:hypothetical protein